MPDIDIIVPVLHRPQNAEPFLRSLRESQPGDVRVVVVTQRYDDDPETYDAWLRQGISQGAPSFTVIPFDGEPGSFAQKCNHGFTSIANALSGPAPWALLVGDDVKFHPRWAQAALRCARQPRVCVVGTNTMGTIPDGSTPHPMIRRTYVEQRGASWDGPGSLCHEGYRHNYVDVEITMLAIDRGVWTACDGARIEHLHHIHGGKAPMDATYELGASSLAADRDLFEARAAVRSEHT